MSEEQNQEPLKFWQKSWVMWICLIFLCPLGLVLCFLNRERHPRWKIIMAVFAILFAIGVANGGNKEDSHQATAPTSQAQQTVPAKQTEQPKQEAQKQYQEISADQLVNELESNAAKASKTYKGKDLKIVGGTVGVIDADANYFSLRDSNSFSLTNITCDARGKNMKAIKAQIVEFSKNQPIVVYGRVSDVGEIMGYRVDIDKLE